MRISLAQEDILAISRRMASIRLRGLLPPHFAHTLSEMTGAHAGSAHAPNVSRALPHAQAHGCSDCLRTDKDSKKCAASARSLARMAACARWASLPWQELEVVRASPSRHDKDSRLCMGCPHTTSNPCQSESAKRALPQVLASHADVSVHYLAFSPAAQPPARTTSHSCHPPACRCALPRVPAIHPALAVTRAFPYAPPPQSPARTRSPRTQRGVGTLSRADAPAIPLSRGLT